MTAINIDKFIKTFSKEDILLLEEVNPDIADVYVKLLSDENKKVVKYTKYFTFDKVYRFKTCDDIVTNIRTTKICELFIDNEPTTYFIGNITLPTRLTLLCNVELRTDSDDKCVMIYDVYNFKSPKVITDLASKLLTNDEGMIFWSGSAK